MYSGVDLSILTLELDHVKTTYVYSFFLVKVLAQSSQVHGVDVEFLQRFTIGSSISDSTPRSDIAPAREITSVLDIASVVDVSLYACLVIFEFGVNLSLTFMPCEWIADSCAPKEKRQPERASDADMIGCCCVQSSEGTALLRPAAPCCAPAVVFGQKGQPAAQGPPHNQAHALLVGYSTTFLSISSSSFLYTAIPMPGNFLEMSSVQPCSSECGASNETAQIVPPTTTLGIFGTSPYSNTSLFVDTGADFT